MRAAVYSPLLHRFLELLKLAFVQDHLAQFEFGDNAKRDKFIAGGRPLLEAGDRGGASAGSGITISVQSVA
jgi:hypothetical protein